MSEFKEVRNHKEISYQEVFMDEKFYKVEQKI